MKKNHENFETHRKHRFVFFFVFLEKHESTIGFPELQGAFLKNYDLFRLSCSLKNKTLTRAGENDYFTCTGTIILPKIEYQKGLHDPSFFNTEIPIQK